MTRLLLRVPLASIAIAALLFPCGAKPVRVPDAVQPFHGAPQSRDPPGAGTCVDSGSAAHHAATAARRAASGERTTALKAKIGDEIAALVLDRVGASQAFQ